MRRWLYRGLLRLHPVSFREQFAGEMLWIFDEAAPVSGAAPFFADGITSLARQWLLRTTAWTMAAGGLGAFLLIGAMMGMAALPLRPIYGPSFGEPEIPLPAASGSPAQFNGHWTGNFLFPAPAGQMEFTLTEESGVWGGELQIRGADGVVHRGVAEDIRASGDALSFRFKTSRGEMIYRGRMKLGKLRGYVRPAAP